MRQTLPAPWVLPVPRLLGLFLLFGWTFLSSAQVTQYPLTPKIKDIRISVQKASVRLVPKKDNTVLIQSKKTIEVKEESSSKKETTTLLISEKDFPPRQNPVLGAKGPLNIITIKTPVNRPITVVLFQGAVEIKSLPKVGKFNNLSISIVHRGTIHTRNTKGTLSISQNKGDIKVHSHKGHLVLQGERVSVHLKNCSGEMSFVGLKGRLRVDNSSGSLLTRAFELLLTLHKFKGHLDFRQEKGTLNLKNMTGSILGYSKEGEVRGLIYPKEVNVETETGKIHLDMPHSRAYVQADTWEGRLFTPSYFRRLRTGGMDRAQGRLKGSRGGAGRVSLKSRTGSIKVYQSNL